MEALTMSFDRLRTNGKWMIPFMLSLSKHERNRRVQRFPQAGAIRATSCRMRRKVSGSSSGRNRRG
jgi:hypothetical protein